MSAESVRVRRGYQIHLQLELQAVVSCLIWVLRTELRSSGRSRRSKPKSHVSRLVTYIVKNVQLYFL